jgi:hypothetical protein
MATSICISKLINASKRLSDSELTDRDTSHYRNAHQTIAKCSSSNPNPQMPREILAPCVAAHLSPRFHSPFHGEECGQIQEVDFWAEHRVMTFGRFIPLCFLFHPRNFILRLLNWCDIDSNMQNYKSDFDLI